MTRRPTVNRALAAFLLLACASVAFAQEKKYPEILDAKPMYKRGLSHPALSVDKPAAEATLPQWNGSFTDLTKKTVTYTMIGTDPSKGSVSTRI